MSNDPKPADDNNKTKEPIQTHKEMKEKYVPIGKKK
jgi:hypothetical protein